MLNSNAGFKQILTKVHACRQDSHVLAMHATQPHAMWLMQIKVIFIPNNVPQQQSLTSYIMTVIVKL